MVFLVGSYPLAFPPITYTHSSSPHSCYMPRPSYPPRLDYSNYSWRRIQITKLLVMQFSLISRHLSVRKELHYLMYVIELESMLRGSLSPQHGASSGCGCRNGLQQWRLTANVLNKKSWTDNKGWPSSLGVGHGVNNPSP
jgi:hypothetical protein